MIGYFWYLANMNAMNMSNNMNPLYIQNINHHYPQHQNINHHHYHLFQNTQSFSPCNQYGMKIMNPYHHIQANTAIFAESIRSKTRKYFFILIA